MYSVHGKLVTNNLDNYTKDNNIKISLSGLFFFDNTQATTCVQVDFSWS